MDGQSGRTGVWLVGARGSVATTVVVGAATLRLGGASALGCVTETPPFAAAGLPAYADLVFGGHDIGEITLEKRAEALVAGGVLPPALLGLVRRELRAAEAALRPGVGGPADGSTQADAAQRLAGDLRDFRAGHGLDRVVVVNVSSTEPPVDDRPEHASLDALEAALGRGEAPLPTSSLYAYAALTAGCSVVDFTPSPGPRLPAIDELARRERLPWAGSDGKTGETLVKAALAPMFAARALRVRSWAGTNLLGGGDGENLASPGANRSKTVSKARGVEAVLGYPVEGPVHIDNVPAMGEWKTAWDHISFEGFLGVRMTMQFTWQGCDSALAAPLVLDLVRLLARAHATGHVGVLPALAFFFKDPAGTDEHRLAAQYDDLCAWAATLGGRA